MAYKLVMYCRHKEKLTYTLAVASDQGQIPPRTPPLMATQEVRLPPGQRRPRGGAAQRAPIGSVAECGRVPKQGKGVNETLFVVVVEIVAIV